MSASSEVRTAWPRSAAASATWTSTMSGWEILPIVTPISFARSAVSSSMITVPSGPRPALISRPTFGWGEPPRRSSAMNAPASKRLVGLEQPGDEPGADMREITGVIGPERRHAKAVVTDIGETFAIVADRNGGYARVPDLRRWPAGHS